MLTSFPVLDSAFSNPADSCPALSASLEEEEERFFSLLSDLPTIETPSVFGGQPFISSKDIDWNVVSNSKKTKRVTRPPAMNENAIDPEEDLKKLIDNETQLRLSGYYYGNLSWVDASHILKQSKVGTFLVRDSEHCGYLYALSVQTKRGPTSCRIDYDNGRFRLDSSEDLSDKMPRFDSVTDLIDHYVYMTKNLPRKSAAKDLSPVWLDEENSGDVPVQIYKPLYKNVRSLQHMCRVNLVKLQREGAVRTNEGGINSASDFLPTMLKNYLKEYPYPQ